MEFDGVALPNTKTGVSEELRSVENSQEYV